MNFLYSDNGTGIFSSLMGSWVFWIVVILVIVTIILFVMKFQKKKSTSNFTVADFFNDSDSEEDIHFKSSSENFDSIHDGLDTDNNDEYDPHSVYNTDSMNNGIVPDLNKFLDIDIDEESVKDAQLLGVSETDKNVKTFYHISSKKESVFKVVAENNDAVNFKLELKDLTKLTLNTPTTSEVKIYNQNRKCIAIINLDTKKIHIRSISPFFDDISLPLEETTRLMAFTQKSNKLFLDSMQVGAFNIYDKITYFYVKSPIIKELQYL
ncbi:hypothetical protein [Drosophila suzukii associated hytrosavirus 1]|nr:hypothetical protein [Drosophila suzukii associated hytrosavirus 1]